APVTTRLPSGENATARTDGGRNSRISPRSPANRRTHSPPSSSISRASAEPTQPTSARRPSGEAATQHTFSSATALATGINASSSSASRSHTRRYAPPPSSTRLPSGVKHSDDSGTPLFSQRISRPASVSQTPTPAGPHAARNLPLCEKHTARAGPA